MHLGPFARKIRFAFVFVTTLFLCHSAANAAVFAQFDSSRHDRFLEDGTPNPSFILDESEISGLGVSSRAVLISPQHYLTARHAPTSTPVFRGSDGVVRTYQASSHLDLATTMPDGSTSLSDIRLYSLDNPIPVAHDVRPIALFADEPASLLGEEFYVIGQSDQAGKNLVSGTTRVTFAGGASPTESFYYTFDTGSNGGSGGIPDEASLIGGDSGHSALIRVGDSLAVLGTHVGISVPSGSSASAGDRYFSFTSLITPYMDQIGEYVSNDGQSISTLTFTVTAVPEPGTAGIALIAMLGLMQRRQRRV